MLSFAFASVALALNLRDGHAAQHKIALSTKDYHSTLIRKIEFKHRLRVCNAYPYGGPLDVYRAKEKLTDEPMAYKACKEFKIQLLMGDKIMFKVEDQHVGTFAVASMPENDAILLLVISRHDTDSAAVSFESHIFANLLNAQLAVIDTYKGQSKATLRIEDNSQADKKRSEELRYDSVVAINPGRFNIVLSGDADKKHPASRHADLVAVNREAYVALRVGVEAEKGTSYPEEVIVFPHSDELLFNSANHFSWALLLAVLVLWN